MTRKRGRFIVIEGLDGAGTSTQAAMLLDHLDGEGMPVHLTREPTDDPLGSLIRDALAGRLVSPDTRQKIRLSESALCLLFAADRIEHSRRIEALRDDGAHVVCDRYVLSSIAYQSLDPGISPERVVEVNRGCSVPDVTFFLQVPVDECLRRLEARSDAPTVYEKRDILERIDRNYEATRPLYEKHFGPLVRIDGTPSVEEVRSEILQKLASRLRF